MNRKQRPPRDFREVAHLTLDGFCGRRVEIATVASLLRNDEVGGEKGKSEKAKGKR